MEGLEGAFDVVFGGNGGHVEAVAAGSWGQSKLFHSVDEVGPGAVAWHGLNDECLVLERDEASAGRAAQV